jgi:para-nitrobenzyl esterase
MHSGIGRFSTKGGEALKMIQKVQTHQGILAGITTEGVTSFLGIPYAAAPVGSLRWCAPQPATGWTGTRLADRFSPVAPQIPLPANSLYCPGFPPQDEDCLTLNLWTPAEDASEQLPVMVWFHLGAFMFGSSRCTTPLANGLLFDGSVLARQRMIVVTVNYRLGRLGFLAHKWLSEESQYSTSGNYGFMDQVAALKWVSDNISAFGGDTGNVTIFGVSAGSASCSLHMVSPLSRGLFHRAIASSGAFMAAPASDSGIFDRQLTLVAAETRGKQLGDVLNCQNLADLRAVPVDKLMTAQIPTQESDWYLPTIDTFCGNGVSDTTYPIVDGFAIPDSPSSIIQRGEHNDVPLLTGSPIDDASGMPAIEQPEHLSAYLHADMGKLAERAARAWPFNDAQSAIRASGELLADRVFGWQNWTWARLAAAHGSAPVFYYDWTHLLPIPEAVYAERRLGAVHGSEMPYIFRNLSAYNWNWTDVDRDLSEIVSSYWVNFARTGDPNGGNLPTWPRFKSENAVAMHFGSELEAREPMRLERFSVLDDYYAGRYKTGDSL